MGEKSKIEWCDHTFNPWIGCTKVSLGCVNCYAERDMDLRFNKVKWGPHGSRIRTSVSNWKKPRKWNKRARENRQVEIVFCASLADVFEDWPSKQGMESVHEWRKDLFAVMESTPWLVWLVLTKRPENVMSMVPAEWREARKWPPHVLIGFSAEDQSNFDYRMINTISIPTPVLWVSAEPLIGKLSLISDPNFLDFPEVDWVIAGGESGPTARPMELEWARLLRDQCTAHNVPFFFKQWGEYAPNSYPGANDMVRVGRKRAGKILDGHIHDEFPPYIQEYEEKLRGLTDAEPRA